MSKIHKFREKLSLLTKKHVTREVDGVPFNFYPISVGMLFELRTALTPIMKLIRGLFVVQQQPDAGRVIQKIKTKEGDEQEKTVLEAPSLEVIRFRQEQTDRESRELVEGLLSSENKLLLGRVLADSMRDDFGPGTSDDEAREFADNLDLPTAVQFLTGFMAANVKVFGPLADRAEKALRQRFDRAVAPAAETPPSPAPEPQNP